MSEPAAPEPGAVAEGGGGSGRERFLADAAGRGLDVQLVARPAADSLSEHGYGAFVDADSLTAALGAVVADISEPI